MSPSIAPAARKSTNPLRLSNDEANRKSLALAIFLAWAVISGIADDLMRAFQ